MGLDEGYEVEPSARGCRLAESVESVGELCNVRLGAHTWFQIAGTSGGVGEAEFKRCNMRADQAPWRVGANDE